MIHSETKLLLADNSGARLVKCIRILNKPVGLLGDLITVTLRRFSKLKKLIKGKKYMGLLLNVKKPKYRKNGYRLSFSKNRILLFAENDKFLGTRVYGPSIRELKTKLLINRFRRIISHAQRVL